MRTAITLFLAFLFYQHAQAQSQFYLKVDTLERCIIDSFEKDTEVVIRVRLQDDIEDPKYELAISIKDIDHRYYESQRFKIMDVKSRNIIYTHLASTEVFVCMQSNKEIHIDLEIDTVVEPPDNLIRSEDMHQLENLIYKTVKEFSDFTSKNAINDELEDQAYYDNISLNKKIFRVTLLEIAFIVVLGVIQYAILRNYIKNRK